MTFLFLFFLIFVLIFLHHVNYSRFKSDSVPSLLDLTEWIWSPCHLLIILQRGRRGGGRTYGTRETAKVFVINFLTSSKEFLFLIFLSFYPSDCQMLCWAAGANYWAVLEEMALQFFFFWERIWFSFPVSPVQVSSMQPWEEQWGGGRLSDSLWQYAPPLISCMMYTIPNTPLSFWYVSKALFIVISEHCVIFSVFIIPAFL